jgi:MYXO-CTERM domain-containing protein
MVGLPSAEAVVTGSDFLLTNGALSVKIRDDNGALAEVLFGGSDFFNPGAPVSDWGIQNGTDTGTFLKNDTNGGEDFAVVVAGGVGVVTATGLFTGGGANVTVVRSYSLVPGQNVIQIMTTFTNNDLANPVTISYFDNVDPDQGIDQGVGFETFNDTDVLAAAPPVTYSQSYIEVPAGTPTLTLLQASTDPNTTVGFVPGGLTINDGTDLNAFFSGPLDPNNSFSDIGQNIGVRDTIAAGGSLTYTSLQVYGLTPDEAFDVFQQVVGPGVPEPVTATLGLLGLGALGLVSRRRR